MLRSFALLFFLFNPNSAYGQFTCTFSGPNESACLEATADGDEHCVWCAVSTLGFCVTEAQAEAMEKSLPGIACDRYDDHSDDAVDDQVVPTIDDQVEVDDDGGAYTDDDAAPKSDDSVGPKDDDSTEGDDSVPDNYWTCLEDARDEAACSKQDGCVWCESKAGFGLCLSGPSAEAAADSDWFTCKSTSTTQHTDFLRDPTDPSCLQAYLMDPTQLGCTSSTDAEGNACEWCSLAGMANVCLTAEQAADTSVLGVTCDAMVEAVKDDPYDPSCLLVYLQDPSPEACTAAVDEDGVSCEFCTLQDAVSMCLTQLQAQTGQQIGMTCEIQKEQDIEDVRDNPYDPSCVLAFIQDPSPDACTSAVDQDGQACEYCTLQGSLSLCLTSEQAAMGEQFGIECDGSTEEVVLPPDFLKCLEHYEQGDCGADGCTWCNTEVGIGMCVADSVADAMRECTFFDCNYNGMNDNLSPYDPACLAAGMQQDNAEESCNAATDSQGQACVWCDAAGVFGLCLSSEQATSASAFLECDAINQHSNGLRGVVNSK